MKKKILIVSSSFYKNLEKKLLSGAFNEINKKLFSLTLNIEKGINTYF